MDVLDHNKTIRDFEPRKLNISVFLELSSYNYSYSLLGIETRIVAI